MPYKIRSHRKPSVDFIDTFAMKVFSRSLGLMCAMFVGVSQATMVELCGDYDAPVMLLKDKDYILKCQVGPSKWS